MLSQLREIPYESICTCQKQNKICNCTNFLSILIFILHILQVTCLVFITFFIWRNGAQITNDISEIKTKFIDDSTNITFAIMELKDKIINDGKSIVKDANQAALVAMEIEHCLDKICSSD